MSGGIYGIYPPTVVMGPPEGFLASLALGLCGLIEGQ